MIYLAESGKSVAELQSTLDKCEAHLRNLAALGMAEETFGRVLAPLMLSKFPQFIRIELNRKNCGEAWILANLRRYLKEEINARHMGSQTIGGHQGCSVVSKTTSNIAKQTNYNGRKYRTDSTLVTTNIRNKFAASENRSAVKMFPCAFCNGKDHFNENCKKFATSEDRWSAIHKDRCVICLRSNHKKQECRSTRPCKYCGMERSHHSSLCKKKYSSTRGANASPGAVNGLNIHAREFAPSRLQSSSDVKRNKTVTMNRGKSILATAICYVRGKRTREKVRIVLDSCSTRSFARVDVLKRINARHIGDEHLGLAGLEADERHYDEFGCYEVTVICADGDEVPIAVNGLKTITCPMDKEAIRLADYPILQKFELADSVDEFETNVQLDILIGLDHYYRFIGNIEVRLSETLVLLKTKLGYVPNGSTPFNSMSGREERNTATLFAVDAATVNKEMDSNLERLWRLEDVGVKELKVTNDDQIAEANFKKTICYDVSSKRYSVRWPWKSKKPELSDNYYLAKGRLKGLIQRLDSNTLGVYDKTIQDQLKKDVIERVPERPTGDTIHYIPHHCVVKPDKTTTKLRIVYDASAKSGKEENSLNESMYRGPVLLEDLCGLIMRFRTHEIGIVSDIEKAFLQVALQEVDRDVTRFLWLKDCKLPARNDNIVEYRFTRVLFGAIASPYILAATIEHHLSTLKTPTAAKILKSCYVDNVITGTNTFEEAVDYYNEAKTAFQTAAMNLREWFSNSSEFMKSINEEDRGKEKTTTVLGLKWDVKADSLSCQSKLGASTKCNTKRKMLQAIAQLLDPCGFLSPVTIKGKIIIQQIWKEQLEWDQIVPQQLQLKWDEFQRDLTQCLDVKWDRFVGRVENKRCELHCFCDASMDAYGAAIYVKCESANGEVCNLIFAKARVSPVKDQKLTIPKLKLTALNLGCKLLAYVKKQLQLQDCRSVAWTDSMCCIHWLRSKTKLPIYVKNRINQILQIGQIEVRYVPSADNPADLPSRGVTLTDLTNGSLWWRGPDWLQTSEENWPQKEIEFSSDDIVEDPVSLPTMVTTIHPIDVSSLSSLYRVLRVYAWVMRFIQNTRKKSINGPLKSQEINDSRRMLIKNIQCSFANESSKVFFGIQKQLRLFLSPDGFLRCSGILDNADLPYDTCFPIFIPHQTFLARLIVKHQHEALMHAGSQHVVSSVRKKYWIPRSRSLVKAVIHDCRICRRTKGGPYRIPTPPPLPAFRSVGTSSFVQVGVDYLGPLQVRDETAGRVKVWICLFTCCTSRAIHLEVINDLSGVEFLLCLRRFVAQYGTPKLIVSDNAKQFHSVAKTLNNAFEQIAVQPAIKEYCVKNGIEWKFIVEFAPWMGGFYERMIGIVKKALRCSIQNQQLPLSELQTVCYEASTIVNSRPLTYYNSEVDTVALTPSDLVVKNKQTLPDWSDDIADDVDYFPVKDSQATLALTWKRLDNRCKAFWSMWRRDYLTALRERTWSPKNRGRSHIIPKLGSTVLISRENIPRGQWIMGRIVGLIRSSDEAIRSARIKTPNGRVLQRPLKLLYPLEVPDDSETQTEEDVQRTQSTNADKRPKRQCAIQARHKWRGVQKSDTDEDEH